MTRVSSAPRWLFFRLAIIVTLVLLLPDVYIWHQGQPAQAVAVLMAMHLAIALITYNLLVHVAPVRPAGPRARQPAVGRLRAYVRPARGAMASTSARTSLPGLPPAGGHVGRDLVGRWWPRR